jgi:ABC-type nitrate/sulfonate/bicarbonate transport system permease component
MTSVAGAYQHLVSDPTFWSSLGHTVSSWLTGCLLSCLIAIPLGILIGTSRFADDSTRGVLEFLKPIPPIALIPVALLVWGPSTTMKLTLIAFGATRVLLIQVVYGVRAVDQVALSMARSYRLGRVQTLRRVVLPGMSPYIVTGLRVSAAVALIVTIVTEMVGGVPGLGQGILEAQNANALPRMYAMILLSGALGLAANGAFELIERQLLRWHPSRRKDAAQ